MGTIRQPKPEKLIVGLIYAPGTDLKPVYGLLEQRYGRLDYESPEFPFAHTDYYSSEMGSGLKRRFITFEKLVETQDLPDIKLYCNGLEARFLRSGSQNRQVNIDPGLISEPKLILASTKNFTHRIYIGKGIYAEVTLRYIGDTYTALEWTYPDYANPEHIKIFNDIRERYRKQLNKQL